MKKIIVITGPTATGKTKLSIELAKKYNGEIINADSTQVYKELNIATAKATKEEMENVPHHIFDKQNPNDKYTIYNYQTEGRKIIEKLQKNNKTIIIVGGSGLYLNALLYDYELKEENDDNDYNSLTQEEMYDKLIQKIPNLKLDKNNLQRIIRAYTKYIINKEKYNDEKKGKELFYKNIIFIGLTTDREILHKRINYRVDQMIEQGLIKEARYILNKYPDSRAVNTVIGYKEFTPYIKGEEYLEDAILKIKSSSRNYAKRQYTWFNHKMDIKWFNVNYKNFNETIKEVENYIEKKQDTN